MSIHKALVRIAGGLALIAFMLVLGFRLHAQQSVRMLPTSEQASRDNEGRRNVVKLNAFMLLHGYASVAYERLLFKRLSLELGGGITGKDYLYFSAFMHVINGNIFSDNEQGEFKAASTGLGGYGTLKLYLGMMRIHQPDGAYLALQAQHRAHYWTQQFYAYNDDPVVAQKRKLTDALLMIGYQGILDDNIVFEVNTGIGMRKQSFNRMSLEDGVRLVDDRPSSSVIAYAFNLKIGYAF